MTLQHVINSEGNHDQSRRLLADFERMGIPPTSPVENVSRRIEDLDVPWNVRAALLMTAGEAKLAAVADSLLGILATLLDRKQTFEELQVIESAWWLCGEFEGRYPTADLTDLGGRTLEAAARHSAGNMENILCAVAEAVAASASDGASDALSAEMIRWLTAMKPEWLHALRVKEVLTPDAERFHRLATGKDVRLARRLLSDWLTKNVEQVSGGNGGQAR